ncbi:MAG: CRISPR-associated endoribonuclease Cas6 [Sulfurihydrogenibium azorense]
MSLSFQTDKQQLSLQLNPTSIKHQNQIVNPQDFNRDILIKAILTRISAVAQSYGEKTEKIYIDKEKINITQQNLEQTILKRYSNRKQRHMNIPAIEGELTLTGDLNQIYGLLKIIENINLGKSVSLGLGSVKLLSENST